MPWHRRASRRHTEGRRVAQGHMISQAGGLDALASEGIGGRRPQLHGCVDTPQGIESSRVVLQLLTVDLGRSLNCSQWTWAGP